MVASPGVQTISGMQDAHETTLRLNLPAATRPSTGTQAERTLPPAEPAPLEAFWAQHQDEVEAAQRLRFRVFVQEMGARPQLPNGTAPGLDADAWDPHCEHLIVRRAETATEPAQVVGTYRVLTPAAARIAGSLYTETEFDLSALSGLRPSLAELGRSCIDPDWRTGGVVMMLWSNLAAFMVRNGLRQMIGCASIPMLDGGHRAASLWRQLSAAHLAAPELRVVPRLPLPVDQLDGGLAVEAPPLIKGYLKCGAQLLGAPAWDPDFGTADLPMMLDMEAMAPAYRRRLLRP